MTFLTELALSRKSVTIMVMFLLLVAGVYSYNRLQQEWFPDISFGTIFVYSGYQQSDPATIAEEVTKPIEDAILGMRGLDRVTSVSTSDRSVVTADFTTDTDIGNAEDEIRSAVGGLNLPESDGGPVVIRLSSDIFPVMLLSVTGQRDIPSLQRVIDDRILPAMEAVDGVHDVQVQGGISERVSVIVDPALLEEHSLTIQHVANAVGVNAIDLSAGSLSAGDRTVALRTYHGYGNLDAIRAVPVGFIRGDPPPGGSVTPILVSDVAEVVIDTPEATTISRTNGQPSVSLSVLRQPEGNTIAMTNELLAVIDSLELPPDVRLRVLTNLGPRLEEQLSTVTGQGMLGFAIAVLAIFLFLLQIRPSVIRGILNTLRPTAIIGISIPLSIMATMVVMASFDWTLNSMSLSGLAIAVGRIVDDSIVVLENTYRHVQAGEARTPAAVRGAREVGPAIVSSTLTTVAVFLPLAFIPGIVGQFFLPFAQTVCVSLIASTLIALTAVPALGAVLLRRGDMAAEDADVANRDTWLQRAYTPLLRWALRHRLITVGACIVVVAASLLLLTALPITLFSSGTVHQAHIDVTMPENTGVGAMYREVREIERVLQTYVDAGYVTSYQLTMGSLSQDFGPSVGQSGYDVAGFIIPFSDDTPSDLVDQMREAFPGRENVDIRVFVDDSGPPQAGLEITVTGADYAAVQVAAQNILDGIETVPGVVNLRTNISDTAEELTFAVDLNEAGRYGLDARSIATQVRTWVHGARVADVNLMGDSYDVVVRGRPDAADEIAELQQLAIGSPLGGRVPLGAVSEVRSTLGPAVITHYDGERSVTITGEFEGRDTRAISSRVGRIIEDAEFPPGVTIRQGGFASDLQEQFANVYLAMAIGVSLVYLVMVATMGSLRDPFIVVLSMPLAVVGALIALYITGRALSLPALMGFLFLIGIVVTNAIVLITFVNQLRAQERGALPAVIEAGRTRLRPILMTAFTTILAILPLAFSGADGIVGAELATVVIGGLISSTFLTLVAVPVTYMLLHESIPRLATGIRRRITRRPAPDPDTS